MSKTTPHQFVPFGCFMSIILVSACDDQRPVVYDQHNDQFLHFHTSDAFLYKKDPNVHEQCRETVFGLTKELGILKSKVEDLERRENHTNPYRTSVFTELCSYTTILAVTTPVFTLLSKTPSSVYHAGTELLANTLGNIAPYAIPIAAGAWCTKIAYDYCHTKASIKPLHAFSSVLSHNFHAAMFTFRNVATLMLALSVASFMAYHVHQ